MRYPETEQMVKSLLLRLRARQHQEVKKRRSYKGTQEREKRAFHEERNAQLY